MVFNDYTSTSRRIVGILQLDSTTILLFYILFCSLSLLLLPLKEMLFREGPGCRIYVVLRFTSAGGQKCSR